MIPISKMFGWSHFMKYDDMNRITRDMFQHTEMESETEVNVYIDLGSLTDVVYMNITKESNDPTELASVILNMAGHIRSFFRTCDVYATIFLVYSRNNWNILKNIYNEYRSNSHRSDRTYRLKYVEDSMRLIEMIVPYLPRVYYICDEAEVGGIIYSTIMKERYEGNNHPNVVFTRELNLLQLTLDSRTVIYYKHAMDKICFGINRNNVIQSYIKLTKRYNPIYDNPDATMILQVTKEGTCFIDKSRRLENIGRIIQNFNPDKLPCLITLTNLPSRGIKYLIPWTTAIEALHKIEPYIDDPLMIYNILSYETKIFNKIGYEEFVNRYNIINIKYQAELYNKNNHVDYRVDLYNVNELKYINDHYFVENYIDLNKF